MGNDVHKSKIAKIEMALDKYRIDANDCLFITDTLGDIKEAHHMKVPTVAVTWGYQSIETLAKGNPSRIVNTSQKLLSFFDK
jgi:phosphoglycolate phosphatase-like HAD superfamily hydrolase